MESIPHSRPTISDDDIARVCARLREGMIAEGAMAVDVAHRLARRWKMASATVTGSGTQALALALEVLGAGPGSEVLCPDYVCPEVLAAIEFRGATAVLVDIGRDYFPSAEAVAAARNTRTAAIVVPFLMGLFAPVEKIRQLGIPMIADCAQFMPAASEPSRVEADLVVLSFEATKLLTCAEGGAVLTNDAMLADRLAACKRLDRGPYKLNLFPLSDLQAALLDAQLDRIDAFLARRRWLAERYRAGISPSPRGIAAGWEAPYSCFFRYPLRFPDADESLIDRLIDYFRARDIAVRRPVDILLHRLRPQPCCFPEAERAFRETLSLPIYPLLEERAQDVVIETFNAALESFGLRGPQD